MSALAAKVQEAVARAEAAAHDMPNPEVNLTLLMVYMVATGSKTGSRKQMAMAGLWIGMGLLVAILEIMVLLSLSINANWIPCNDPENELEECPPGTSCANLPFGDTLRKPLCLDCKFVSGLTQVAWTNTLCGAPGVNSSEYCINQLYATENIRFFQAGSGYELAEGTVRTNDHCLYARAAWQDMSSMDTIILAAACLLLTIQVGGDVRTQNRSSYVRRQALPWPRPERTKEYVVKVTAYSLIKMIDLCFLMAVPCLIPCAMFMLIASDASSTSIILNGLSIGFTVELDQQLPFAFLSAREIEEIDDFLTKVLKGRVYKRERWTDLNFRNQIELLYAAPARITSTLLSYIYGYLVFAGGMLSIPCEMLVYFCFYRTGILMSLWVGALVRESFELIALLTSPNEVRQTLLRELKENPRQFILSAAKGSMFRFIEPLSVAVMLNFFFGLACTIYWNKDAEGFKYSIKHYVPGFVEDIFGACAASGYKDDFNLDCLPL